MLLRGPKNRRFDRSQSRNYMPSLGYHNSAIRLLIFRQSLNICCPIIIVLRIKGIASGKILLFWVTFGLQYFSFKTLIALKIRRDGLLLAKIKFGECNLRSKSRIYSPQIIASLPKLLWPKAISIIFCHNQ